MNRSPAIAGVLSVVFPGLGHFYAGANHRAVALGAVCVALLQAVNHTGGTLLMLALPAAWLFGIVDAIRVAEETARAAAAGRPPEVGIDRDWAVALVAAGVVCTFAVIPGLEFATRLWPLALVAIGIQILRGQPILPRGRSEAAAPGEPPPTPPPPPPAEEADAPVGAPSGLAPSEGGARAKTEAEPAAEGEGKE